MERISIFNYEAYYLDFLEGNLSEGDTALLLAFLEKNPTLELIDADFLTLDADASSLSIVEKENLKQVDETGIITLNNVEHFLIGQQEGILAEDKLLELNDFVNGNPALEKEREYIKSAVLIPDTSIVYHEKVGLKQKKTIVLWPYIASIAAACLLFFVWVNLNGNDEVERFAEEEVNKEELIVTPLEPSQNEKDFVANEEELIEFPQKEAPRVNPVHHSSSKNEIETSNTPAPQAIERLQRRAIKSGLASVDDMEIELKVTAKSYGNHEGVSQDPLWGFGDTENPIEPITAGIKKRFNTDVDFRSKKPVNNKPGGFFLKIGKFEVARKKH
ncbi:MAG: hypothetical protein MK066_06020 [Crocinitomicaceae bacterium]|nr:hypothetical protein [Crocinitomicaceae bacterium]